MTRTHVPSRFSSLSLVRCCRAPARSRAPASPIALSGCWGDAVGLQESRGGGDGGRVVRVGVCGRVRDTIHTTHAHAHALQHYESSGPARIGVHPMFSMDSGRVQVRVSGRTRF